MSLLYLDIETDSSISITDSVYRYAEGAKILLIGYAFDDGPVQVWDAASGNPQPMPDNFRAALYDSTCRKVAHNVEFDRTILRECAGIDIPIEQWICTMAWAHSCSFPGSLASLGEFLGLPADKQKDQAGRELIKLFSIARRRPEEFPDKWAQFIRYLIRDVEALREIHKRLPPYNYGTTETGEYELWCQLSRINQRGILIDTDLCEKVCKAIDVANVENSERIEAVTEGTVHTAKQVKALRKLLEENHGIKVADLKAATVDTLLGRSDLHSQVREILELRQQGAYSAQAKYARAKTCACVRDNRVRGTMQYYGAHSGRIAGRMVQPQNFPRNTLKEDALSIYRSAFRSECIDVLTPDVLQAAGECSRTMIIAPPGKTLLVGDYASIEVLVLAWLAKETWVLDAFAKGEDLYIATYAKAFGIQPGLVTPDQRQIGKAMMLAFGFGGGVGALLSIATIYDMDVEQLARVSLEHASQAEHDAAMSAYQWASENKRDRGISREVYAGCEILKRKYRSANTNIMLYMTRLEAEFRLACRGDGKGSGEIRSMEFFVSGVTIQLPSGRSLVYPKASIRLDGTIYYTAMKNGRQVEATLYGGKLAENVTQAVARDVLEHHVAVVEEKFDTVLLVHDEIVCEAPIGENPKLLADLMTITLPWHDGLPLGAKAYSCDFYHKR